jgi:hypothetical protein
MKLDKFARICINIVLILLIALLLKSFITIPKDLYAKSGFEYKTIQFLDYEHRKLQRELGEKKYNEEITMAGDNQIESILNWYAKKGWRLHTVIGKAGDGFTVDNAFVILER